MPEILRIIILVGILLVPQKVFSAPPFMTDDSDPVDYHHWEIDTYSAGSHIYGETSGALPGVEIDYGALANMELHFKAALAYDHTGSGALHSGYSDTELGIKYRFINAAEGEWWPEVAVAPLLELPTGDTATGLGTTGKAREFLPLWLEKTFGAWTTYGGGGFWNNPGMGNRNYWFFGDVVQRKINEKWTLGGEVFYQTSETIIVTPSNRGSAGFNFGAIYGISDNYHIMLSAGRAIEDAEAMNAFSYYIGLQTTF
jgi:hypothetical protein